MTKISAKMQRNHESYENVYENRFAYGTGRARSIY